MRVTQAAKNLSYPQMRLPPFEQPYIILKGKFFYQLIIPKIDNLLIFFCFCVFKSLISSAFLFVFCVKYYKLAFVNHRAVTKIKALIPAFE